MKVWGALEAGTVIAGTYRVVKLLGRGGMGEVYEAEHVRTGASLAIKVLLADFSERNEVLSRFKREAETTSRLRHPNIVRMFDFDSLPDGRPFLAMELLSGADLSVLLRSGQRFAPRRVVAIVDQVALALAAAHGAGVIHRDLSPGNIFIEPLPGTDRDLVRVLDFGISKVRDARSALTQTTSIMGTPYYMSPEQAKGKTKETDARSDQFALAAITYELLVGRRAFAADDPTADDSAPAILYRAVHVDPPRFQALGVALPQSVEAVVFRALAKDPAQRYPSVMAFAEALADAVRGGERDGDGASVATSAGTPAADVPAPGAGGETPISQTRQYPSAKIPSGGPTTLGRSTGELGSARDDRSTSRVGRRRAPLIAAAAIGAVALGGLAVVALLRSGDGGGGRATAPPAAGAVTGAASDEPTGKPGNEREHENPAGRVEPAAAAPAASTRPTAPPSPTPAPSPTPPPSPTPADVDIAVDDAPHGTNVWEGDERRSLPLKLPAGSGAHRLTFKAAGHKDLTIEVAARAGERVSLKAMARSGPERASSRAKRAGGQRSQRPDSAPSNEDIY